MGNISPLRKQNKKGKGTKTNKEGLGPSATSPHSETLKKNKTNHEI